MENTGSGNVSRWEVGVGVGGGKTAPCSRHEPGHAAVSGHESPFGNERSRMNAPEKLSAPPRGAEHHQIYVSTNVRKSLDTTVKSLLPEASANLILK
jgi:hypothetical protein